MTTSLTGEARSGREKGPLRVLVFSASLRKDSLNTRLAKLAAQTVMKFGGTADPVSMSEFDCPSFNQDLVPEGSYPPGAEKLKEKLLANDAFIIASPEYNGSLPGNLKNTIDWVSRYRPQPFNEHHALLMSASPSMAGGNRALWSLRIPLEHLGTRVYPDMFSLAVAHQAFSPDGSIGDSTLAKRFEDTISAFMSEVEAVKNYPCIKKAWIEFLGEKSDPLTERAGP
jgi:NAD(P)H-dependent FMN reductase